MSIENSYDIKLRQEIPLEYLLPELRKEFNLDRICDISHQYEVTGLNGDPIGILEFLEDCISDNVFMIEFYYKNITFLSIVTAKVKQAYIKAKEEFEEDNKNLLNDE